MPEQLLQRVEHCYQQAETFFKQPFTRAEVSFKLRGQKAGVAHLTAHLRERAAAGAGMIVVSHDLAFVHSVCDRVLVLEAGDVE